MYPRGSPFLLEICVMKAARRFFLVFSGVAAMLALGAISQPVLADGAPVKMMNGVLVNASGMTLYTYDKDPKGGGKSACNGGCAKNWPPLMATASDQAGGDYSIIKRDDGSMQWAYKGSPLYLWVKDKKPGDMTGDNFKSVWHVVR
jgi:predicted lipoprotein with Yx(FWY)xxD motif